MSDTQPNNELAVTEEQELDLSEPNGLRLFAEHANELWCDIEECGTKLVAISNSGQRDDEVSRTYQEATTVWQDLQQHIEQATEVLARKEELIDEFVERLQENYDRLFLLYERLDEFATTTVVPKPDVATESQKPVVTHSTPVAEPEIVAQAAEQRSDQTDQISVQSAKERTEVVSIEKVKGKIAEVQKQLRDTSTAFDPLWPVSQRPRAIQVYFIELTIAQDRLNTIVTGVDSVADTDQISVTRYLRILDEISENVSVVHKVLLQRAAESAPPAAEPEEQPLASSDSTEQNQQTSKEEEGDEEVKQDDVVPDRITQPITRGVVQINSDSEAADSISISVVSPPVIPATPAVVSEPNPKPEYKRKIFNTLTRSSDSSGLVSAVERRDPLNKVVPDVRPRVIRSRTELQKDSLTARYLIKNPVYRQFITDHYSSFASFERLLDSRVSSLEVKTTDPIERWLGDEYESAFVFMQDRTIAEIYDFDNAPEIRDVLKRARVKYETYVMWLDLLPDMQEVVQRSDRLTFGELYARWMVELEMRSLAR